MYVKNNLTFDETCSRMFAKVCVSLWLLRLLELPAVRSSRKESKDDRPAIDFIHIGEKIKRTTYLFIATFTRSI